MYTQIARMHAPTPNLSMICSCPLILQCFLQIINVSVAIHNNSIILVKMIVKMFEEQNALRFCSVIVAELMRNCKNKYKYNPNNKTNISESNGGGTVFSLPPPRGSDDLSFFARLFL